MSGRKFTLDLREERLLDGDQPVRLTNKAFRLLQYFVQNPNRLLTKDAILDDLWPGVHVSEALIKEYVHDLRAALGDDPKRPEFIETAHGRGYRFLGGIVCQGEKISEHIKCYPAPQSRSDVTTAGLPISGVSHRGDKLWPAIGILPCILCSQSQALHSIGHRLRNFVAKILFENGAYALYDCCGLSEDISLSPAKLSNSVGGPDLLLSLWLSETTSVLEVTIEIRESQARRLVWTQSVTVNPDHETHFEESVSAYVNQAIEAIELWLLQNTNDESHCAARLTLGSAHLIIFPTENDLDLAEQQLNAAFELDRSAVQLGWLALLDAVRYDQLRGLRGSRTATGLGVRQSFKEVIERIEEYTARALEIDRSNSLSLSLLGHVNAFVARKFDLAEDLIERALQINPYRPDAWDARAMLHIYSGDVQAGYDAAIRAKSLGRHNPFAYGYDASWGIAAALLGRYEEAVSHANIVLAQRPNYNPTIRYHIASLAFSGRVREAQEMYGRLLELEPDFSVKRLRDPEYPIPCQRSVELIETGIKRAGVA